MKNTQRLLTWILVAVLAVATFALVACDDKPETVVLDNLELPQLDDDQAAIIIANRNDTYTVHVVTLGSKGTDATTVEGVLNYLKKLNLLDYAATDGWMDDIAGLNPDRSHEYVALYTSVTSDWDRSAYANSYQIGEVTVTYSAYGISQMKFQAGALIYFQIETF